ncbi:hypothetical protein F7725_019552 [Dissostichus mawsoni]|uniref:Protein c-Fos n=1 Tax=Dissostichus mawsoni TaxID=36200 RepID=A0A7J5YKX6_DISMA|nr:hypothetical protein F7725_019552 [Dissostichus mawsoni]
MHPDSNIEFESSSSCSTASPGGETPGCSQHPPDSLSSSVDSAKDTETSGADSFVPTVTAISTSLGLMWMVQPTVITSVSPSASRAKTKTHGSSKSSSPAGAKKTKPSNRKGLKDKASKEEEERRRIRRERNKIAAAKCRNRRRELIDTLQASTAAIEEASIGQDMDSVPCIPAAAILGNSNILLCSSAEEEDLEDLRGDDLDDLVPSLEMAENTEMAASVPDIDLSGPFGLSDWETLYKSVANDLETLSSPVMSSSPTCSNYRSVFSFNYSEIDSFAEGFESLKGSLGASESMKDSLNSPTLLAL